ncbi:MAG: protoporphyrinogen oxidase [candidate division KSB1 bacterium]|nr:protoporphyrinogen oxidase [candidate division KSB1 bacterium]
MNVNRKIDVCVIGAGISGLSTAFFLKQAGKRVVIFERQPRVGGVIVTERANDYLFEHGPNSTLATSEKLSELIRRLDLQDAVCEANSEAANRYILRDNRLRRVPLKPNELLSSDLLSRRARLRVIGELFVPAKKDAAQETVAEFVQRRLGREFLDYVINPFVAGVYAGDPAKLNIKAAFRKVYELERQHGGLIRGAIVKMRQKKRGHTADKSRAAMFSYKTGMKTLPEHLAEHLQDELFTQVEVLQIRPLDGRFELQCRFEDNHYFSVQAREVVVASPAYVAASLVADFAPETSAALEAIPYAPVAVVFSLYNRADVRHPLNGFGFLVPQVERREILGCIWSSSLFPGRAPANTVALTTFIGGMRQPELMKKSDDGLLQLAHREVKDLLNVQGPPILQKVRRWPRAIPQYVQGHLERVRTIRQLEARQPGLYFTGNYLEGISVADCVETGWKTAQRMLLRESGASAAKTASKQKIEVAS